MDTTTLAGQARQMWDTRPLRARRAPIAGVCTGFARRYQVDVALVRAAFIGAMVLGGIGFFAYLAGIFLLPKEPAQEYAPTPERSGPPAFVLIIAAVLAVTLGGNLGSSWPGAGLISAALLVAGWYALHQRTPVPPPGTAVSSRIAPGAPAPVGAWQPPVSPFPWQPTWQPPAGTDPAQPQQAVNLTKPDSAADAPQSTIPAPEAPQHTQATEQIHPPRWDPLGAAPFAWDLPEPASAAVPVPVPKRRSRVTTVTLGAALLTAAALAAVNLIGLASISPVLAASIVLGVIGTGLVYGAFRRSGYGLLAAAIPLAGFIVIGTAAQNMPMGHGDSPRGEKSFTVTDAASLQSRYTVQAGSLKLDLRDLALDHDRTVSTHVALGDTEIIVPETMNVRVTCSVGVGETECPSGLVRGKDAKPDAPTLTIEASGNVGNVEVDRD